MSNTQAGWYDDGSGSGRKRWWDGQAWTDKEQAATDSSGIAGVANRIQESAVSGAQPRPAQPGASYVVLQVILKEKLWGTGSGNLTELEGVLNRQAALGYRLHTITTAASGSKGFGGGDRIQATMVFEKIT
jgi:predicted Zn-dependent protease